MSVLIGVGIKERLHILVGKAVAVIVHPVAELLSARKAIGVIIVTVIGGGESVTVEIRNFGALGFSFGAGENEQGQK